MRGTSTRPRRATRLLSVAVILALLAGGLVLLERYLSQDPSCASPPTQEYRAQQESFVTAHLPDARDFAWTVMDCDEEGQAYVEFTTRQRGTVASEAFLRDPACKPSTEPDASSGDVTCASGTGEVSIYFEDHGAIDTEGQLSPEP